MKLFLPLAMQVAREMHGWHKAPRHRAAMRAFHRFPLGPGDIAIDCGANIGDVTLALAAKGATVHAFEPFPEAFAILEQRTRDLPHVHCQPCAVADASGSTQLFLHRHPSEDPLEHSSGSSLVAGKHNLDPSRSIHIEQVDLAEMTFDLDQRVKLLKIDIEGFEVRLLDSGAIHKVDQAFCETHEFKVTGLYQDIRQLRRRLAAEGIEHVNLDWC